MLTLVVWLHPVYIWVVCCPRDVQSDCEMSFIEYVWDKLRRVVRKCFILYSILFNLRQVLLEEWVRIPQRYIQTLINSMRRRCSTCRDAHS